MEEKENFSDKNLEFSAVYEYCSNTDEYLETEDMIKANNLSLKDAYRRSVSLLTSGDIKNIRAKYEISQKEFSEILDWGGATITRYENHQIQDRAHDDILRKIESDPKWFLDMIKRAKDRLSSKAYIKYYHTANELYNKNRNQYLIDSINAIYANYEEAIMTGGMGLNLNKVIEVINYLAGRVNNLHKVKMMKMLWYSDMLNYKRYEKSITGLVYSVFPMGAVPVGYEQIVLLDGVIYDTVWYDDNIAYRFRPIEGFEIKELSENERDTIDKVISEFGDLKTEEIINKMHEEDAYIFTSRNCIIPYSYAVQLSID